MPIRIATPQDAAQIAEIYAPSVTDAIISFDGRLQLPACCALGIRIARHGCGHEGGQCKNQPGWAVASQNAGNSSLQNWSRTVQSK